MSKRALKKPLTQEGALLEGNFTEVREGAKFFTGFTETENGSRSFSQEAWLVYWKALSSDEQMSIRRKAEWEHMTRVAVAIEYGAIDEIKYER